MVYRNIYYDSLKMFRLNFGQDLKRSDCPLSSEIDIKHAARLNSKRDAIVDKLPLQKINDLNLSFMDSGEIERNGVRLKNTLAESFSEDNTDTVLDRRLGTSKNTNPCKRCCQTTKTCHGHIGYIPLKYKLVHPMCRSEVAELLTAVCHDCGSLIYRSKLSGSHSNRMQVASMMASKIGQCSLCGEQSYIVSIDKTFNTSVDLFEANLPKRRLTKNSPFTVMDIPKVANIIERIPDDDIEALGYSNTHPRAFIISNLVVPAIQMRPMMIVDGMKISPITKMYDKIIETNSKVQIGAENFSERNNLFLYVNRIMGFVPLDREQEIQGFTDVQENIKGKKGIIRGNIIAKRVDYCSRSVLGPGSEAAFGEVSYPYTTSRKVTTPIKVTQYNKDYINELWNEHTIRAIIPGNPIHNYYNQIIYVNESLMIKYSPQIGDTVYKRITSGDPVTFNRQPTLSRYSILGKRAIVTKANLYCNRINSSSTVASNADFDGDEGNIYPHQGIETKIESEIVSNIRSNIINVLNGGALISIEQHGLIGLYLLSDSNYDLDDEEWEEALNKFSGWRGAFIHGNYQEVERPEDLPEVDMTDFYDRLKAADGRINGRACISLILPRSLNLKGPLEIKDGILVKGKLDKSSIKKLVKNLVVFYGTEIAADFITAGQRMADWYNGIEPTSMSYSDIVVPEADEMIKKDVELLNIKLNSVTSKAKISEEAPAITEMNTLMALNVTESVGTRIAGMLPKNNSINVLRLSGAKGSIGNTAQMVGMIGQIVLNGVRPPYNMAIQNKYPKGSRSLPYFEPLYWPGAEMTPESKGFCSDSYRTGIDISSIFFSLGDGRNGLITTKLGTADNGYFARKLVRSFEDYMASHDGSVVSTMGRLISSGYLDGIAPQKSVNYQGSPKVGEVYGFVDFQKLADII